MKLFWRPSLHARFSLTIRKPCAGRPSAATNPRMKLSNRNKDTLFQRFVPRPDADNRNTSGMTSRKRSDASMRRTEVYSPSLRRACGSLGTSVSRIYRPRVSDILDNDGQYFQHPIKPYPFVSSSSPWYPTAESFDPSISRGEATIGIPKWQGGMTRRTRGKTLPDRWSGNAFIRTAARTILTQVIS